jgi:hypothetical protein
MLSVLFPKAIKLALANYDKEKGVSRRLLGDHPAIKKIRALKRTEQANLFKIYQCFLESPTETSQASHQVYVAVLGNPSNYQTIENVLNSLSEMDLLTRENFNSVRLHVSPVNLASTLNILKNTELLTKENFARVVISTEFMQALDQLNQSKLLTQENFDSIAIHANPIELAMLMCSLKHADLLTEENINIVIKHVSIVGLAKVLDELGQFKLLTQANFAEIINHISPIDLAEIMLKLNHANLLTPENMSVIIKHADFDSLTYALSKLGQYMLLLTQENFDRTINHTSPIEFVNALCLLHQAELLQENAYALVTHADIANLIKALDKLNEFKLLTQENAYALVTHADIANLIEALDKLSEFKLLTQENAYALVIHADIANLIKALDKLSEFKLLTQENAYALVTHADIANLIEALYRLSRFKLLTQENFTWIIHQDNSLDVADVIINFNRVNLLTRENITAVLEHRDFDQLVFILEDLIRVRLLTQENLANLLAPAHQVLCTDFAKSEIWSHIPNHLLTQEVFNQLLMRARQENAQQQLRDYCDHLLYGDLTDNDLIDIDLPDIDLPVPQINDAQSTHYISVHQSVSETAIRLQQRYGMKLQANQLDEIIARLEAYLAKLDNTPKNEAAQRCIRIIIERYYIFTDPASGISTQQILALVFLAIEDDTMRIGSFTDGMTQLIEALYEIQRGYNLSEQGLDDQAEDKTICQSGSFNKLIEKLQSIHPDCEIRQISKKLASLKLPVVVREECMRYLSSLAQPKTIRELLAFTGLLEQIKTEGLEPIWLLIKTSVAERMLEEFGLLYEHKTDYPEFIALIDSGIYTDLADVSRFQAQVQHSLGYQQYCSQILRNSGLFSSWQRLISANNQPVLDEQKHDSQITMGL